MKMRSISASPSATCSHPTSRLRCCSSKSWRWWSVSRIRMRRSAPLTLREFESEALVLLNEEFATRHYIDRYCRQHGIAPRIAMEVNSISAITEIVRRSTLAALLPAAIAREHGELRLVDLEPALPQRTAALLLRKDAYRSAAARAFIALALEESAAEPGGRQA
jgi:LysR family cyn operon transcriptional activator